MFLDFFRQLFQSRVDSVRVGAKAKVYSAQARVKGKIATKFNKTVDKGVAKVTNPIKSAVKGGKPQAQPQVQAQSHQQGQQGKPEEGKKKMGFWIFGKGKKEKETQPIVEEVSEEAKTQAINISQFDDTHFQPCVGWVVILEGPQKGRDFRLVPGRNRIGTEADMEVVLTDPYVSGHHATIVFNDEGKYILSDAGSTNGTKVNGKRVMQAQIVDNDTLTIGHTTLKFKAIY